MAKKRDAYISLKERDGLVCGICGGSLDEVWAKYEVWKAWKDTKEGVKPKAPFKRGKLNLSIDHIMPKSVAYDMGMTRKEVNALENLQLTHKECNVKKGNKYDEKERQQGAERLDRMPRVQSSVLFY